MSDPFCPRHGRASRPIEVPGLPCDCAEHPLSKRAIAFAEIHHERERQEQLYPGRSIRDADPLVKLRILTEEIGEVADAAPSGSGAQWHLRHLMQALGRIAEALDVTDANTKRDLCKELVQVGACAVAWLEAIG